VILKQYYLGCLAHASYLIADEKSRVAAIVDPKRDVGEYVAEAKKKKLEIRHVILTHFHADFVAGHLELRDLLGAQIHLGARADAEYEFVPHENGSTLDLGPEVRIEFLETPGHTPEGVSLVVFGRKKNAKKPHAVLTGDTLFIGDVGRPDLMASAGMSATELAGQLYDSLHKKLLKLPDETLLYPAHGAGSLCGRNLSDDTVSTIGAQRSFNYALQPMSKKSFVKLVTADQSDAPDYFSYDAQVNRKERATLEQNLARVVKPLPLSEVRKQMKKGAQVVDVRPAIDFEAAHLTGSLNIGLGDKYATWAGSLLDREKPIIIIADAGSEEEAAMRLGRIGLDNVEGYLEGGMHAFDGREKLLKRRTRITPAALARQLRSKKKPVVIDIRSPNEWKESRIEGSLNFPLNHLRERAAEIPKGKPLVIHCGSGYRSAIGASVLAQHGIETIDLVGGMGGWDAAKLPTVSGVAGS
jgi:glyoxylase-like metal-dependent hydrolase (beta-lactamase superfamily II)/rhodanese-related sulfurtransferase